MPVQDVPNWGFISLLPRARQAPQRAASTLARRPPRAWNPQPPVSHHVLLTCPAGVPPPCGSWSGRRAQGPRVPISGIRISCLAFLSSSRGRIVEFGGWVGRIAGWEEASDHLIHSLWLIDGETEAQREARVCPKSNGQWMCGLEAGSADSKPVLAPPQPLAPLPSLSSWGRVGPPLL